MTGSLLGVSVLELRTDQTELDLGLATARRKVEAETAAMQASWDRRMVSMGSSMKTTSMSVSGGLDAIGTASGRVGRSMSDTARATADSTLKLKGYELAIASAETRVKNLSTALAAGHGDQQKLNDALQIAQGRLDLARGRLDAYGRRVVTGAAETRSLAAETGVSARAMRDLYEHMGPVGTAFGDLTTRTRLFREHGVDYLSAGVVGLEAAFLGMSAKAAVSFADLGDQVQRQTGLSGRALDELMATIRTVARDSPFQLQEVANAAVILRQAFHETNTEISTNADLMVAYAKAAGQDVTPAVQQLSRIMHDYREPLGNVVGLTDKLVSISQATQQPLSSVANALDRFGPRFQAMGLGLNQSIRLLGVFAASGIPVEEMGRGLATVLTQASKATQDSSAKLIQYHVAVQTAQQRVAALSAELKTTWAGNQAKVNDELQIAQERLTIAKGKYDALTSSVKVAKGAHGDLASVIQGEVKQIVDANSKQDAMNIAVQAFGKNLGPSMARAFYDNQKALDAVDKAMGKAHTTQRLFNVDAKSMPGELERAKNNLQDLEIEVGQKLVPALSHGVDWIRNTVHGFDDFYKHHSELVDIAGGITGIGAAITLLSRHSPLGDILSRLLGSTGRASLGHLGQFLAGPNAGGGVWGVRGPTAGGSEGNPVAVKVMNPGGGGSQPKGGGGAAGEGDAAAAEDPLRTTRVLRIGGAAVAGVSAFSSMSHAQGGTLNQLNAAVHGVDPTSVLHLVGLPAVSDLLPSVKKRMNLTAQDIAWLGEGFSVGDLKGLNAMASGHGARQPRDQAFGAPGVAPLIPSASAKQSSLDFDRTVGALAKLEQRAAGVEKTAHALDDLAAKAKKAGDVRWQLADKLGAEMLRTRSVASKGSLALIHELDRLPPAARADAAQSMTQMAQMLEEQGKLPLGSSARLVSEMLTNYKSMHDQGGSYFKGLLDDATRVMDQLRTKIRTSTGQQRQDAIAEYHQLQTAAAATFGQLTANTIASMQKLSTEVKGGSSAAAAAASENFDRLASNIGQAMRAGVINANTGVQDIAKALNEELKTFGAKPLPMPSAIQWASWAAGNAPASSYTTGSGIGHRAGGGLIQIGRPGEAGRDSVPLNVGGTPVVVAPGEQVAVFNRHQLPIVNRALAGYGGLPGLFDRVSRPNYMAEGGLVPHLAAGGTMSYGQLEGLWDAAGGPKDVASIAAAIAMAESGGRDVMQQGQPWATTGWGYWQITPGGPQYFDPMTNARAAVAKYHGDNDTFRPWTTFNDGAYRAFLRGAVPAVAGGAAVQQIPEPKVQGDGTVADITRAALKKVTDAANAYLEANAVLAPSGGSGAAGAFTGPGGKGAFYSPSQLETFDGKPVARWIVPELEWARQHGWQGAVTSGWRSPSQVVSGVFATAPQGQSEHQYDVYPHGAVDVSDYQHFAEIIRGYTGSEKLIQLGIDPLHFSGTGHARGGIIHADSGVMLPAARSSHTAPKRVKATKLAKPLSVPKLKAPAGFPPQLLGQLTAIDTMVGELGNWQSFIQALHSRVSVSPTITDASGNTILNPGAADAPINTLTGLIDPSTGQLTKGINDRLREIGSVTDRVSLTSTSLEDTELGLEETLLGEYLTQRGLAGHLAGQYGPWLSGEKASHAAYAAMSSYLQAALNDSVPFSRMPPANFGLLGIHPGGVGPKANLFDWLPVNNQVGWGKTIREKATEYKNLLAKLARIKKLQAELPIQKRDRENALATRFLIAKNRIQTSGASTSFSSGQLLSEQLAGLTAEEKTSRDQISSTPPKDWLGDRASWNTQAKAERDQIAAEYSQRKDALRKAAAAKRLAASISKSEAMLALDIEERADKTALADVFASKTNALRDEATGVTSTRRADSTFLNSFLRQVKSTLTTETGAISAATGSGGLGDQLKAYLDPMGTLAINIAQAQNIDIPNLLDEIAALKGTTPPSSLGATSATDSQRASLLQQQLGIAEETLAVSQAQYSALSTIGDLPPFGGSFAQGGVVPGPLGAARTVIAHAGETITPPDEQPPGSTDPVLLEPHLHFSPGTEWLRDFVQVEMRNVARSAGRRLPSAGGGQVIGTRRR